MPFDICGLKIHTRQHKSDLMRKKGIESTNLDLTNKMVKYDGMGIQWGM